MKANRRLRPLLVLAAASLATLVASCSERRIIPPPAPTPTPRPAPPAPPPPPPRATTDWRAAPITPGDWSWGMEGGQSVARFAGGTLTIRCDRAGGTITLQRAGAGAGTGPEPMTITTTSGVHTLSAVPRPGLVVTLAPGAPVLDAMIFSRGRFAVETPSLAPIYVPSWPEVGRVVEDCR